MEEVPDPRRLSRFLLALHGRAHELPYRAMQRAAFDALRELLPFDSGLFAVGTLHAGHAQVHDIYLYEQPPELMASWEAIKTEDRLAFAAVAAPGTTISVRSDELFADNPRARAHCARFGLTYMQTTAHVYAGAGLYWVMSLYRGDHHPPFAEIERATNELVSPHLFAATRAARLGELRTLTRVGGGHGQVAGIAALSGLILEAEPALAELLQVEWPDWRGPFLPAPLVEAIPAGQGRFVGRRIVVRVDAAEDAQLVHVRRRVAADGLTEREREIAAAFALGESHREIGDRLGIAPATVRRHLANLYEKLGVSSKAELDRMLRGVD